MTHEIYLSSLNEKEILEKTIELYKEHFSQISLAFSKEPVKLESFESDGQAKRNADVNSKIHVIEIKTQSTPSSIKRFIEQTENHIYKYPQYCFWLITKVLDDSDIEILRSKGISCSDLNGNICFQERPNIYIRDKVTPLWARYTKRGQHIKIDPVNCKKVAEEILKNPELKWQVKDLSEKTGLKPWTVSDIINYFLKQGLVDKSQPNAEFKRGYIVIKDIDKLKVL